MKKTFNTKEEIMSMEELVKEFVLDLYESQTLELDLKTVMNLIINDELLDGEFAFNYAISQSKSDIVFIEKDSKTNEIDVKTEFIVLADDAVKMDEFISMIYDGYSMEDIKRKIKDLDLVRKKVSIANKAQLQLELYNLAIDYIEVINVKIESVKKLYQLVNA